MSDHSVARSSDLLGTRAASRDSGASGDSAYSRASVANASSEEQGNPSLLVLRHAQPSR